MTENHKTFKFVQNFECIGANCSDTCCKGWTILIDKKRYQKYRNSRSEEIREISRNSLKKISSDTRTDAGFAEILLDKEGRCAFLKEDQLCKVYEKLGERNLSKTCATFPREIR